MSHFSSVRVRLVGTVFLAIAPAWVITYLIARKTHTEVSWPGFVVGLLALAAAWYGGERFILRQVRALSKAVKRMSQGDLTGGSGLAVARDELGELAVQLDRMGEALNQRVKEREQVEKTLLTRSLQQTVVSALGQFALVSSDLAALLSQAVMLVSQTLEVEYCAVFEMLPGDDSLLLRAGTGWKDGRVGVFAMPIEPETQLGFTLRAGEPVVVEHVPTESRFRASGFLEDHGVVSGVSVAITDHGKAFGVLGAHTTNRRRFTEDEVHFLLAVATVLAMAVARQEAEAEMQKLARLTRLNPNPALELASDGVLTYCNEAALKLAARVSGGDPSAMLPPNVQEIVRHSLSSPPKLVRLETEIRGRTLAWAFHPVTDGQLVHVYAEDITERLNLEAQLRQAQKMESVGQLAAGVAHDFNNMLTVIQGHSGLLLARPDLRAEQHDSAQAIYFAAERAASLTRQLLMFSRKNVMQPKPLDLREVVRQMTKMLKRLLGETIQLEFNPPAQMPLIQGDEGMLEQVIMNLAVNARDAMPKGGKLTIHTTALTIDPAYVALHPQARVGPFVCLRVADSGCGIDTATLPRIFEPFFTTKEVGKGTGLGLATVYSIMKQHNGWIDVASKVGQGTSFEVFFPASTSPAGVKQAANASDASVRGGRETILVVEDEAVLRDLAHVILESCGYRVLEAATGVEALRVWQEHHSAIDLLVTDMVMPEGVSGLELAQKLQAIHPGLKIIFASGYSLEDIDTTFLRERRAVFLQKPYTHVSLAQAVRKCLDDEAHGLDLQTKSSSTET